MDREEYHAAETAFSEGFRLVSDKLGFLRLARIPLELGRASPGFGSCELVYQPLPGTLVTSETRLSFRYVSAVTVREFTLAELLARSNADAADAALLQHHHHPRGHHEHDHGENTVKQNT